MGQANSPSLVRDFSRFLYFPLSDRYSEHHTFDAYMHTGWGLLSSRHGGIDQCVQPLCGAMMISVHMEKLGDSILTTSRLGPGCSFAGRVSILLQSDT